MPKKLREFLIFSVLILTTIILFYFRLLFISSSFIEWGNFFEFPLDLQQLIAGSSYTHIFWSSTGGDGLPNVFPSTTIINFAFGNYLSIFLELNLPIAAAIRVYIIVSVFFLSFSFFTLTKAFSSKLLGRIGATVFFLFNPAQILLLTGGDFLQMFSLGFLFLSIYFVILGRRQGNSLNIYIIISIAFMFLTLGSEQVTYLGIALWIVIFILFTRDLSIKSTELKKITSNLIIPFLTSFILMFLIFLPFILSTGLGSVIRLGPSSPYAQSLSEIKLFSNGFFPTLFLEPWTLSSNAAELSVASISVSMLMTWNVILYGFLLFMLAWGFIVKRKVLVTFSLVILIAALLGSGPKSVLPTIPIFLYAHLPGYQLLNASYYWDWIIIGPLYSLVLLDILNYISVSASGESVRKKTMRVPRKGTSSRYFLKRAFTVSFLVALIIILVAPTASQGYYSSLGIINRGEYVPQSYYGLTGAIDALTQGTSEGVAFFPPNQELVLSGGSPHFNNPLYNTQSFRAPYMAGYGLIPANISQYFNFVYNEFYSNETDHVAELMGLAGIDYFVVLKGVENYNGQYKSQNASLLMKYQTGISLILNTKSYAIYESNYNPPTSFANSKSEIIIGNYYTLLELANEGVNLFDISIFLSSDINANDWKIILDHSRDIILQNNSDLTWLYLLTTNLTTVNPYEYINYSETGSSNPRYPLTNWAYGPNYYVPEISQISTAPQNFIFTGSNSTVSLPIHGSKSDNTVWVQLWFSGDSRNVSFFADGKLIQTVNTYSPGDDEFKLVKLNYSFNNNQVLQMNSSGLNDFWINAIGNIYLTNGTQLSDNEHFIHSLILNGSLRILTYSNLGTFDSPANISNATFEPTVSGFKLVSSASGILNVNYPYYSTERSNGIVLSSLGGVNQVVIPASGESTSIYFISYQYWVYGSIIQVSALVSSLLFLVFRRKFFSRGG